MEIRHLAIVIVIVGAFLFYYGFTHTFDYLDCKDVGEGLSLMKNPTEAKCDCNFVSNKCYNTMSVVWSFDSETDETLETRYPHKSVFKDWGLI